MSEIRREFEVWRTAFVGGKNTNELFDLVDDFGVNYSDWFVNIIRKPGCKIEEKTRKIDFTVVSPSDLGILGFANTEAIFFAAKKHGLNLCPHDAAAKLVLGFDNDKASSLVVASEPIVDLNDVSMLFLLYAKGERMDDAICTLSTTHADYVWHNNTLFVFAL